MVHTRNQSLDTYGMGSVYILYLVSLYTLYLGHHPSSPWPYAIIYLGLTHFLQKQVYKYINNRNFGLVQAIHKWFSNDPIKNFNEKHGF